MTELPPMPLTQTAATYGIVGLLTAVSVGLAALRRRFGLAPLYLYIGLLDVFMMTTAAVFLLKMTLFSGIAVGHTSMVFIPVLLASFLLVYALEGPRETRGLLVAFLLLNIGTFVIRYLYQWDVGRPGVDPQQPIPPELFRQLSLRFHLTSGVALIGAAAVMIMSYQALQNRFSRLHPVFAILLAYVAALVADGAIIMFLYHPLEPGIFLGRFNAHFVVKASAAIPCGLVVGLYVRHLFKQHAHLLEGGVLRRGAFELIGLRKRLQSTEEQLEQIRTTFSSYVDRQVVAQLLQCPHAVELGGEEREVTVLFVDIRSWTRLSAGADPRQVIRFLNAFLDRMVGCVFRHRGMIADLAGDGLMAVFGAPQPLPDHRQQAVGCAQSMLVAMDELNQQWQDEPLAQLWQRHGLDRVRIGVGLHSGPALVGNVGSDRHKKYAVVGDTVNTAARIEALTKEMEQPVLISQATREALPPDSTELIEVGEVTLRGRDHPTTVYALTTPSAP